MMQCLHRNSFDSAINLVGCRIVEAGSATGTSREEFDAALGDETVAVVWVASRHVPGMTLTLEETLVSAHSRAIPVIVEAAAELPPASNLSRFTNSCGADLVIFSGGKALGARKRAGCCWGGPIWWRPLGRTAVPISGSSAL